MLVSKPQFHVVAMLVLCYSKQRINQNISVIGKTYDILHIGLVLYMYVRRRMHFWPQLSVYKSQRCLSIQRVYLFCNCSNNQVIKLLHSVFGFSCYIGVAEQALGDILSVISLAAISFIV